MAEEDGWKNLIKMVAEDQIMLHDDPQNLMKNSELINALEANSFSRTEIADFFRSGLILPVIEHEELYHASITMDFLNFQKKLAIIGFTLKLQQKIAAMYYPLFWAMSTDVDYELEKYKQEKGRALSKKEVAYLRAINELAVANSIGRIEQRIIKLEAEGGRELEQMIQEMAKQRKTLIKRATFGYQENEIGRLVKEIWRLPLLSYQGREIKAFINIDSINCNNDERKLLWGGHFDFSLCDEKGNIQLVIEYNGSGHYGTGAEQKRSAITRDNSKKSLCTKAGIPMIVLTTEFAIHTDYKKVFTKFLLMFKDKRMQLDLTVLHDMIAAEFNLGNTKEIATVIDKLGQAGMDSFVKRLDIYTTQERRDLLLSLLWELYATLEDFAKLEGCLDAISPFYS